MTERRAMCKGFRGFLFKGNFLIWDFWTPPPLLRQKTTILRMNRVFNGNITHLHIQTYEHVLIKFLKYILV